MLVLVVCLFELFMLTRVGVYVDCFFWLIDLFDMVCYFIVCVFHLFTLRYSRFDLLWWVCWLNLVVLDFAWCFCLGFDSWWCILVVWFYCLLGRLNCGVSLICVWFYDFVWFWGRCFYFDLFCVWLIDFILGAVFRFVCLGWLVGFGVLFWVVLGCYFDLGVGCFLLGCG